MINPLKRKTSLIFFSSLACFTWASSICFSLPSKPVAKSGSVQVEYVNAHTMTIKASDGAILQYEDFQVGEGEEVLLLQSANACVYHHVTGNHSTQILGSIRSPGKVVFTQESGVFLGPDAKIQVSKLQIESPRIEMLGSIDATSKEGKGGEVHLFGQEIVLQGSKIDVSGLLGGGEVLIGGEFQGRGTTPYASKVLMDASSQISANAIEKGDGGLVVLWSQDQTVFAGKIFARGGRLEGNGGLAETSSKGSLEMAAGKVDTWGMGKLGQWLLDPHFIKIVSSGNNECSTYAGVYGDIDCENCKNSGTCNIPSSAFLNLTSSLTLISYCGTIITSDFTVTTDPGCAEKANLTFESCASDANAWGACAATFSGGDTINPSQGIIQLPNNGSITMKTDGGSIHFSPPIWTQSSFVIDTTYNGASGGDIFIPKIYCMNHEDLTATLAAGTTGNIQVTTMPDNEMSGWQEGYLRTMTINSAKSFSTGGIRLLAAFTCNAPFFVSGTPTIDTTAHGISTYGGNIVIQSVEGPGSAIYKTGSNFTITLGPVGMSTPVSSFVIGSDATKSISLSSIATTSGDISITLPATFVGDNLVFTTQGGNINLGSSYTFSGSRQSLFVDANSGSINIPTIPSFQSISIAGSNVTIGSGLSTSGELNLKHNGTANISGSISAGESFQENGTGTLSAKDVSAGTYISISGSPTLAGTFVAGSSMSFSDASVLSGTFTAGTSISFSGGLTLGGTTVLTAPAGISVGSQIDSDGSGNYDLNLVAGSGSIAVGGNIANLRSFTIASASAVSLYGINTLGGAISIPCPVTVMKGGGVISSAGGDLTLGGFIYPYSSNVDVDLVINTSSATGSLGSISVQGLGNATYPFKTISVTGSNITLGKDSNIMAANGPLYISGALGLSGNTILQGSKGITLAGTISFAASNLDLTLGSGTYPLTIPGLGSSSAPLGNLNITASNLILGGDLYASSSIQISSPITISTDTTLSSLSGNGGITLLGPVMTSSSNPNLTLQAASGPLDIQSLGSSNSSLGAISLTGSYITLNGDINSASSMNLSGPITTTKSLTLSAAQGITLNQDLVPNTSPFDLTLQSTGGTVVAQNLGTDAKPLKNISIFSAGSLTPKNLISQGNISLSGTTITLGSTMTATGDITIANTDLLTIPSGSLNLSGNFNQTGSGKVSLGMSLATSGSIGFAGDVTFTGSTTLQGSKGITISGTLAPSSGAPSLTLDAGSNPLTVQFTSSDSNPFGALAITASNLILQGDVYSNTSITIDPPISISSDAIFDSLSGYGGVLLLGPITASSGNPSLTVKAAKGPADVDGLGTDDAPLGNVSVTGGTYIHLGGDVVSKKSILIDGPTNITGSCQFTGLEGITFTKDLIPSESGFDLSLQTSEASITTKNLGKSGYALQSVSLTCSSFDLIGSMTANTVIFNGETCSSGNWSSGMYTSCPTSVP